MSVVAFVQGSYFLITGIWSSLIHIDSFQRVTGRKTDLWLVKTVGILVSAIGAGLILAGVTQQLPELEEMPTQVYKSMSLMVNQPMQHAIIKLPKKRTWMVKTPTIEPAYAREERVERFKTECYRITDFVKPKTEVERQLEERRLALTQRTGEGQQPAAPLEPQTFRRRKKA